MINQIDFYANNDKMKLAMADAIQLFGENIPYTKEQMLNGMVVLFPKHFTDGGMEAFTTGCMARLSPAEKTFFMKFIDWQQWLEDEGFTAGSAEDIAGYEDTERDALQAYNNWLVDEMACTPHQIINECFDSGFEFVSVCPV